MNYRLKISCCMLFLAIACFAANRYWPTAINSTTTEDSLKKQYIDQLQAQETALWEEITTTTGICKQDCQKDIQEYSDWVKIQGPKDQKAGQIKYGPLSKKTVALVHDTLQTMGNDPKSVILIPYQNQWSPAAADIGTIFIDEQALQKLPIHEQRFVLAHEIGHLLHNDSAWRGALETLVPKTKKNKELIYKFARFQEERADITALLQGVPYTTGGITFFDAHARQGEENLAPTHPKYSYRKKVAQKIDVQLKQVSRLA